MKLIISFPDQSQSFVYGVEFGRILEKIERGDTCIKNNGFPIRIENTSVIMEACEKYGFTCTLSNSEIEGWIYFLGIKKTTSEN